MKGLRISKHHLLLVAGAVVLLGTLLFMCHRLFATRTVSCSFDSSVSCQAQTDVVNFLMDLNHKSTINPSQIIQELNQQFKWIDSVAVLRAPGNQAAVSVEVQRPFCILNAHHVMTDAGMVVQKQVYAPVALARLQTVYVPGEKLDSTLVSDVLRRYLAHMPDRVYEQYEVHCLHDLAVLLRDKTGDRFAVMCNPHDDVNHSLLDQCARIKHELRNRGSLRGKKQWVADVRFANQIIVSGHTGGVGHGTSTC